MLIISQKKFVSNHFELENDVKMTLERGSYPGYLWARQLVTSSNVCKCIECFHSHGQHLCKFIGTKESLCIRKEYNPQRIGLGHQHGRRFIVLGRHVKTLYSWFATTLQCGYVGGQYNRNFARKIYMKIEFSSQRRDMLLFLTTNMAAVTSLANQ